MANDTWIDVAPLKDFPLHDRKCIPVENTSILVFHLPEGFFAIENYCPHQGLPLNEGSLSGDVLTCPFHGAKFNLKTGKGLTSPAFEDVLTFEVRLHEGMIQVKY